MTEYYWIEINEENPYLASYSPYYYCAKTT